jgi:hypothetical protein
VPVIVHAPTHRAVKGTDVLLDAVAQLRAEGLRFELVLVEGVTRTEARRIYEEADLCVDQLFAGWYGGLAVAWALGLVTSPLALWALPIVLLTGLAFAAIGLVMTALSPSYDFFMYYFTLAVTPMMLVCGVFFPVSQLPAALQAVAQALPLTHAEPSEGADSVFRSDSRCARCARAPCGRWVLVPRGPSPAPVDGRRGVGHSMGVHSAELLKEAGWFAPPGLSDAERTETTYWAITARASISEGALACDRPRSSPPFARPHVKHVRVLSAAGLERVQGVGRYRGSWRR